MNYIIPTLNRPTLDRAIVSIIDEDTNANIIINSDGASAGENRNKALKRVSEEHEWIIFLDDDDFLGPGYLKQLDSDYQIVIFRMLQNGVTIPRRDDERLYFGNVGINFAIKTRHYLQRPIKFDSDGHGEDWRFFERLLAFEPKIKITNGVFYHAPISNKGKL